MSFCFDNCKYLNKLLLSILHLERITFENCKFDFKKQLKKPPKTVMYHDMVEFDACTFEADTENILKKWFDQESVSQDKILVKFQVDFWFN